MNGCTDRWTPTTCESLGGEHLEASRAGLAEPGQGPAATPWPLTAPPPADINECVADLHTCSRGEHCVNTVGSFHCYKALTCEPGYAFQDGECAGEEGRLDTPPLPCPAPGPTLTLPRAFSLWQAPSTWVSCLWEAPTDDSVWGRVGASEAGGGEPECAPGLATFAGVLVWSCSPVCTLG